MSSITSTQEDTKWQAEYDATYTKPFESLSQKFTTVDELESFLDKANEIADSTGKKMVSIRRDRFKKDWDIESARKYKFLDDFKSKVYDITSVYEIGATTTKLFIKAQRSTNDWEYLALLHLQIEGTICNSESKCAHKEDEREKSIRIRREGLDQSVQELIVGLAKKNWQFLLAERERLEKHFQIKYERRN